MAGGIDRIGSVPEKSFEKSNQFDLKNKEKDLKAEEQADDFSKLVEKNEQQQNDGVNKQKDVLQEQQSSSLGVGDKILNAIQGVKGNIDNQGMKVQELLTSDATSMKDMLQTQQAVANLTLTQELIGKIVGKTTQSFETLQKMQ